MLRLLSQRPFTLQCKSGVNGLHGVPVTVYPISERGRGHVRILKTPVSHAQETQQTQKPAHHLRIAVRKIECYFYKFS